MASFIQKLLPFFSTVVISVILDKKVCKVFVKIIKNSKVTFTEEKKFDINEGELSRDVINYVNSYQDSYKYTYIGTLLGSINQGAISGCSRNDFKRFGVMADGVNSICIDNKWATYGFKDDILSMEIKFNKTIGVDFIFSPFIVLYNFFKKDFSREAKLYVLCQKSHIALGVFKDAKFIFGAFFSIGSTEDTFKSKTDSKKASSSSDKTKAKTDVHHDEEELDELVFFEDDEDVISLDDHDSDKKSDKDDDKEDTGSSIEEFNEGIDLHNYIKSAIEEFYKNDKYETEFLNEIVIADNCNLTNDIIKYIKDELMISVIIKDINIAKVTADIIEKEVVG